MAAVHKFLSTSQVAQMLGASTGSVANWIDEGQLKAGRTPGGHRRVANNDLVQFLRRQNLPIPAELEAPPTRILIVDDEPGVRQYMVSVLEAAYPNYQVLDAADGFAAGELVTSHHPAVVVLDLSMPGMDGFEVCRRIKANPACQHTRIVAITGEFTPERQARILAAGARSCLQKPILPGDLLKEIEAALVR